MFAAVQLQAQRAAPECFPGDLCRDYSADGINQHSYTVSTYTIALVFYNPKRQARAEYRRSQAQYSVIENRPRWQRKDCSGG